MVLEILWGYNQTGSTHKRDLQTTALPFFLARFDNALGAFRTIFFAGAAARLAIAFAVVAGHAGALAVGGLGTFGASAIEAVFSMVGAVRVACASRINGAFLLFVTTAASGQTSSKHQDNQQSKKSSHRFSSNIVTDHFKQLSVWREYSRPNAGFQGSFWSSRPSRKMMPTWTESSSRASRPGRLAKATSHRRPVLRSRAKTLSENHCRANPALW